MTINTNMKYNDFKGNFKAISELKEFHNSNKNTLLITGNVGTGKSTIFEILRFIMNKFLIMF